jgi:PIN domain nuclease of toxin-antitoxin system
MAQTFVLDAYALLALFQNEPGAARVQQMMKEAQEANNPLFMTTVNLGEVAYGLQTKRGLDATIRGLAAIAAAPIKIVDTDYALALHAARLKASTGAGYLDCFAAALAESLSGTVVTGDRGFEAFIGVSIEWLPTATR